MTALHVPSVVVETKRSVSDCGKAFAVYSVCKTAAVASVSVPMAPVPHGGGA